MLPNTLPSTVLPKALKPGSRLAIISPAAPTPSATEAFERGKALLAAAGYDAVIMPNAAKQQTYLAGTDEERLADLHGAFADPTIDGILCARGGYGCMRLLPHIDWSLLRQNPKVMIGFSDLTALLVPLYQQTGLIGFYGPMLTSNLLPEADDTENPTRWSQTYLFQLVSGTLDQGSMTFPYLVPNQDVYQCFQGGVVQGPLLGGNLSLLSALCGTPYQAKTEGHLLFIEDWKESYYTLDRQFQQLKLAGFFENAKGLILCDFSEIPDEYDYPLAEQLRRLTADLDLPCGYGFSVGHGAVTSTLPIGAQAEFNATTGSLTLLASPVHG